MTHQRREIIGDATLIACRRIDLAARQTRMEL